MMNHTEPQRTTPSKRDFLRLALAAGGSVALAPFLKACNVPQTPDPTQPKPEENLLEGLRGLNINAFIQEAYRRWLARDPETLTTIGLADRYGVGDGSLTDISDPFVRQTQSLEISLLDALRGYDRATLTPSQALTASVFDWFLDDLVRGHPFMYDDYPVNPIITSLHYNLYILFTSYHPLNNIQDARDYVSRLSQVGTKMSQLVAGLRARQEHGVVLPAFLIPIVLEDINAIARAAPSSNPYYKSFTERLTGVSEAEQKTLSTQVQEQIKKAVLPGYQELADFLQGQQAQALNAVGVWQFRDGQAYYAQCLRHHTTSEESVDTIHDLGLQHVERIHSEMRSLFSGLGYPSDEGMPELFEQLARDSGSYNGQEAVTAYEEAIRQAETILPEAFDALPRTKVSVIGGTEGDFYMPAPYDGSRPGLFYARTTGSTPRYGVKSLAYHETIPGHHLQAALAQETPDLPDLLRIVQFNAYVEGWALYAERLMWELGVYEDDPMGDLGRLQLEVFRAARLVVDTGLHAKRWTFDKAVDYLVEVTGYTRDYARREIVRYSVWPGQAASYYVGFLKLLELRQKAQEVLGSRFDLKAFHRIAVNNGSVPLSVLEDLFKIYYEGGA